MKLKSILQYTPLLAIGLAFTSCSFEQDDLFDASAAERLNESKAHYTNVFSESKGGWVMEYYPKESKAGSLLLMNFNKDGSVVTAMKDDKYSNGNYLTDKSCWEIITDLGPVLSFNTWNDVIHKFSVPEDASGKGDGKGYEGDYEFVITDAVLGADHCTVKGKKRGLYQRMTRLPEGTDYEAYLDEVNSFRKNIFPENCPNYLILEIGDSIYTVEDMEYTSPDIWPHGTDRITFMHTHYYTMTKQPTDGKFHLRFSEEIPVTNPEKVRELVYDEEKDLFEDMQNPAYVLRGPYGAEFMKYTLTEESHTWTFARNANMSADMKDAYDKLYSYMGTIKDSKGKKYTLTQLDFAYKDDVLTLAVAYKSSNTARSLYDFKVEYNGNKLTLEYDKPHDDAAQNMYDTMSAYLQPMFDVISGTYEAKGANGNFVLKNIKLTSTDGKYFTLKY